MSESKPNISAKDKQKYVDESLCKEVGHLFHVSSIEKNVNNNNSNQDNNAYEHDMSWETTKAFAIGLEVNEQNQILIDLRKSEAEAAKSWCDNKTSPIKVSSALSMIRPLIHSSSLNWNILRTLINEDNTILTGKGIQMLKAITKFSEEQIRGWHAGILRDCPNGKLSKNQFVAGYEQLYPGGKANHFCKHAFAMFDRDNTGTIEFYEFMLAIGLTQSNDLDLRFALAFDMHNYNDTETMDANELAKAISTLFDLIGEIDRKNERDPKHRAEEIIRMCDVTGNNTLTKKNFIFGCKNDPVIHHLIVRDV